MKKALTIGLVAAALAATLTFVAAGSFKHEPVTEADAMPAYEVLTAVRAMRLNPTAEPVRQGPYYVLNAIDPRGVSVRVVADAQYGDILSVAPLPQQTATAVPSYQRGPRIIQVPQAGERNDRASINNRGDPGLSHDDDDEDEVAPPPRRHIAPPPLRTTPRWSPRDEPAPPPKRRSEPAPKPRSEPARPVRHIDMSRPERRVDTPPPQPPGPRRAVLSAPPPPAEGPTPIRPTPRFDAKPDAGPKFAAPTITADTPPPGYTPPTALPQDDGFGNKY